MMHNVVFTIATALISHVAFRVQAASNMMRMEERTHPGGIPLASNGMHPELIVDAAGAQEIPRHPSPWASHSVGRTQQVPSHPSPWASHSGATPQQKVNYPSPGAAHSGQSLEQPRRAVTAKLAPPGTGDVVTNIMPEPASCSDVHSKGGGDIECIDSLGHWVETLRTHWWPNKDKWTDIDSNNCNVDGTADGLVSQPLASCELAYHDATANMGDGVCVKLPGKQPECWALLNHVHPPKDFFACQEAYVDIADIAVLCSLNAVDQVAEATKVEAESRRRRTASASAAHTTAAPEEDEFYGYDPRYIIGGLMFVIFVLASGVGYFVYSQQNKAPHYGHGHPPPHGQWQDHGHGQPPHGPGYGHGPPAGQAPGYQGDAGGQQGASTGLQQGPGGSQAQF